jgi:hypothetical protein
VRGAQRLGHHQYYRNRKKRQQQQGEPSTLIFAMGSYWGRSQVRLGMSEVCDGDLPLLAVGMLSSQVRFLAGLRGSALGLGFAWLLQVTDPDADKLIGTSRTFRLCTTTSQLYGASIYANKKKYLPSWLSRPTPQGYSSAMKPNIGCPCGRFSERLGRRIICRRCRRSPNVARSGSSLPAPGKEAASNCAERRAGRNICATSSESQWEDPRQV